MAKPKKIEIVVGSTSRHKLEAVRMACKTLGYGNEIIVTGIPAESGQNAQPVGLVETMRGALARAEAVQKKHSGAICVGIESGINSVNTALSVVDMVVVIALMPDGRQYINGKPSNVEFPKEDVLAAQQRGFKTTTVGQIISERLGKGDGTDPHSLLTDGKITRQQTLADALRSILPSVLVNYR